MDNPTSKKPIWNNVGTRAVTAVAFAILCFIPLYFGGWVWTALVSLLGGRMMWEWVKISDTSPTRLAYIIPIIGVLAANIYVTQELWLFSIATVVIAAVIAAIERSRRGGLLWAGLGYLYIIIPSLAIVSIRGMETGFASEGFAKLIFIIFIVIAADVGAYFGGSYFKGAKMAPKLSPNKTWSGFMSGMTFGALIGGLSGKVIGLGFILGLGLALSLIHI